jgi:serine/threonine protein kinase
MQASAAISALPPSELCGCTIDCALSPENFTYLAIGPGGRGVVLKKLDPEVLWKGSLHPNVKDRLARVRELAHRGVANLLSVTREGDDVYAMWEYVEGKPFDEYFSDRSRSLRELAMLARELILTVDLLHTQGIVHGALIGGNVIVTPTGSVRLTHISPLLYSDFAVDVECVVNLLWHVIEQRNEQDSPLGRLLEDAATRRTGLRELGARIANLIESRADLQIPLIESFADPRRRALYGAALVAMMGIATAYGLWHAAGHNQQRASQSPSSYHLEHELR